MKKKYIIGISGASGVGKTTLSNLISYLFNINDVLVLSGDDLHKWERNNSNWDCLTHFNPKTNNLDLGYTHLVSLKKNQSIHRKKYNHDTGTFDNPVEVFSKNIIIYEGLHSLYHKETLDLMDLKIYVDTDDELTTEWKIKRDTLKRGYSEEQVKKNIILRKQDKELFITPQKKNADIIINFVKKNIDEISIDFTNKKCEIKLINKLKTLYYNLCEFINLSKWLSTEISLTQESGGNISIKYDNKILIKSSGIKMSEINMSNGFSICVKQKISQKFENEIEYNTFVNSTKVNGFGIPSMEFGFHNLINENVVIHIHPIYLNIILCSKESKKIISTLFNELDFVYIPYTTPGFELTNKFIDNQNKKIYFLENHGLVIGARTVEEGKKIINLINEKSKNWIYQNIEEFIEVKNKNYKSTDKYLFPDAVVFPEKLKNLNQYILDIIEKCCLEPKFLTYKESKKILDLQSEKKRKKVYESYNSDGRIGGPI